MRLEYLVLPALLFVMGIPAPLKKNDIIIVPAYIDPALLIESPFKDIILEASEAFKVCPILINAVILQESSNKHKARSRKGAGGLMQIMPKTAKALKIKNVNDPYQNIMGGTRYLAQQLNRYKGNLELALAAYNAGPETVRRFGGVPPYKETKTYIANIKNNLSLRIGNLAFYNPIKS